ncbi:MAG: chemotaxis protein CheD [Firmicutes bacterium]|nr:chemotaxis protein CheD [Bacillota bacterium]
MGDKVTIGIAEMSILQQCGTLVTYALGSCIGICLYDPTAKIAAMIHIMLPLNMEAGRTNTMKYADTGIRETLKQMTARGASRNRIVAKIAGGAKMFELSGGTLGNIGLRNVESVRMTLRREEIPLLAEDVGGTVARTLYFDASTGQAIIRSYGRSDKIY